MTAGSAARQALVTVECSEEPYGLAQAVLAAATMAAVQRRNGRGQTRCLALGLNDAERAEAPRLRPRVDLLGPLPPTEAKDEEAGTDHLAAGSMIAV
jgi:hypothetical protein